MGLQEIAAVISVGGYRVLVVTGQFAPSEGTDDVRRLLLSVGRSASVPAHLSAAMLDSIERFGYSERIWAGISLSDEDRAHLLDQASQLTPFEPRFEQELVAQAANIRLIADSYYQLTKSEVESAILQDMTRVISQASYRHMGVWETATEALKVLQESVKISYAAFFAGKSESDTVLTYRVGVGDIPAGASNAHFNWRKAGLRIDSTRGDSGALEWEAVRICHRDSLSEGGFRVVSKPFPTATALVPVRLHGGPFGLLVLGPCAATSGISDHEDFLLASSRELARHILALHLRQILQRDRGDWRNSARLTGHRVRASLQSVRSQVATIQAVHKRQRGFTEDDLVAAQQNLERAISVLTKISYAAESSLPGAMDVAGASRQGVPIREIIYSAIADQQDLADEYDIRIEVLPEVERLGPVYVNDILMQSVFVNLINNGLKYSYPNPTEEKKRVLRVKAPKTDTPEVAIEVENFGLGIKRVDQKRVFDWEVRLAGAQGPPAFRHTFGQGLGLWEVKYIVEGHGGRVWVESNHHSGVEVDDSNIGQCITRFGVGLPWGVRG